VATPSQFVPVDLERLNQPQNPQVPAVPDGFADELFAPLDTRPEPIELPDGSAAQPAAAPEAPAIPALPPAAAPAAPPAPQPEVITYDDGSSLTVEKTNKGWRAILDSGAANAEIFYGKTKDEMWTNVAAGKINATRKIRDLNRKLKLTARPEAAPAESTEVVPQLRNLTADEIYEIKNQLNTDPALAFDTYFQKRSGLTIEQLVSLASEGRLAKKELEAESVARVFKARHPEYVMCDENYKAMVGWLARYRLNRTLTDTNQNEIMNLLYDRGHWTPESLDEAFEDLAQDGLLELDLEEEEEEPETAPPAQPAVPAPNPRIANVRVGQRAGLGIRQRETTTARQPDSEQPPSDEDFDRMSDAEITAHFAAVRRHVSQSRR
jgi:hypothetical protein